MNFNPYQAPTSAYDTGYTNYGSPGGVVSERTVAALRKTRPWVMFIGVVTMVLAGFSMLAALVSMFESVGAGIGMVFGTALYLLPAVALIRYGSAINKVLHGGGTAELEQAMEAQASVWQILGIFMLLTVVMLAIMLVFVVALGAAFSNAF
jgi:hypothetical protein